MEVKDYTFCLTADGSPTLKVGQEAMHNSLGAFAETLYVYEPALDFLLSQNYKPAVLSFGLGLGYVEILTAAKFLQSKDLVIHSFESRIDLSENFLNWVLDKPGNSEFYLNFDLTLKFFADHFKLTGDSIKLFLKELYLEKRWQIFGEITQETQFPQKYNCILFDAFSSKATPDLWEQDFLEDFLNKVSGEKGVFASYAACGNLTRALKYNGFKNLSRSGFGKKRNCTLAMKTGQLNQWFDKF